MAVIKNVEAPHQYKQPSRKGKKAWRKHVDVSEVQTGLEIVRDEVIKGGVIAEKPSEALFTLDTTGSEAIQKSYNRTHKPLKADQILAQRSAIPAVDSRKRSKVTNGVIEPSSKRRKGNGVTPQEYERLKNRAYGGEAVLKDIVKTDGVPEYDPWEEVIITKDPRFSYIEKRKPIRAPCTLKEAPISLLEGAKVMPAVVKPKAGLSYNPNFEDWDQLLVEEGEKEVEAEKKRIQEAKEEQERLARIAAAQEERDDIQTEDESAWEGFESEYEAAEWLKKKRPERKTPAERNKIKRRQAAERLAKHEARFEKRETQRAKQIQAITTQMQKMNKLEHIVPIDEPTTSSDSEIDDRYLRRRKLGTIPIPEKSLELVLPDELQDSLRLLKPEGNLTKERFRSLLLRGKIESRKPIQQPKRAKRTYTEKWTYKDFTVAS